jgi:hypothetical protein
MSERLEQELALVRSAYPDLEFVEDGLWARVPAYPLPPGWGPETAEIAFQFRRDSIAEEPYGFWVRPPLKLGDGADPTNSSGPVATAFGDGFQQFSWAPDGWAPAADLRCGTNMLDWIRSFARRLAEIG